MDRKNALNCVDRRSTQQFDQFSEWQPTQAEYNQIDVVSFTTRIVVVCIRRAMKTSFRCIDFRKRISSLPIQSDDARNKSIGSAFTLGQRTSIVISFVNESGVADRQEEIINGDMLSTPKRIEFSIEIRCASVCDMNS